MIVRVENIVKDAAEAAHHVVPDTFLIANQDGPITCLWFIHFNDRWGGWCFFPCQIQKSYKSISLFWYHFWIDNVLNIIKHTEIWMWSNWEFCFWASTRPLEEKTICALEKILKTFCQTRKYPGNALIYSTQPHINATAPPYVQLTFYFCRNSKLF